MSSRVYLMVIVLIGCTSLVYRQVRNTGSKQDLEHVIGAGQTKRKQQSKAFTQHEEPSDESDEQNTNGGDVPDTSSDEPTVPSTTGDDPKTDIITTTSGTGLESRLQESQSHTLSPVPQPTTPKVTCNFTRYKLELNLDPDNLRIPRGLLAGCRVVFYNRIPKSASRTMKEVFDVLGPQHNFTSLFVDDKFLIEKEHYMELTKGANDGFVLTSHFFFEDFTDTYADNAIYINVLRDPVAWFESLYFWSKYGSVEDMARNAPRPGLLGTLQECAANDGYRDGLRKNMGPLRFMCGSSDECTNVNSDYPVKTAISNIEKHYLVVGVYENLFEYMEVLEFLMPHLFSGIHKAWNEIPPELYEAMRTIKKDDVQESTRELLRSKMQTEYRLYNYSKERFRKLLAGVRQLKNTLAQQTFTT